MATRPKTVFLDAATLGPGIDTGKLDALVDAEYYPYSTPAEVAERIRDCKIAITNKAPISGDAIAGAPDLELIVVSATGTDNVATAVARERGVAVANIRDYCSTSVVQHVFALVLGLTQHVGRYHALVVGGEWTRSRSFALFDYPIRELAGRTLGIIGYGSLGQAVGRLGESLGMRLAVAARRGLAPDQVPSGRVPFETVLEQADVLTLHCPLTEATHHMIGRAELGRMKRDALLINTARGALVDNEALVEALREGRLAGAGIDVLPTEPPTPDDVLLRAAAELPNLIVTPHIAWAAKEARQRALDQVTENIAAYLRGERLRRVV
ncbi:MAG TPA: D-2-hydroxyacid dehydrogenase [Gammaproteobacteria bacterium]